MTPVREVLLDAIEEALKDRVRDIFANAIKSSFADDHPDMAAEFRAGLDRALTAYGTFLAVIDNKVPPS